MTILAAAAVLFLVEGSCRRRGTILLRLGGGQLLLIGVAFCFRMIYFARLMSKLSLRSARASAEVEAETRCEGAQSATHSPLISRENDRHGTFGESRAVTPPCHLPLLSSTLDTDVSI